MDNKINFNQDGYFVFETNFNDETFKKAITAFKNILINTF